MLKQQKPLTQQKITANQRTKQQQQHAQHLQQQQVLSSFSQSAISSMLQQQFAMPTMMPQSQAIAAMLQLALLQGINTQQMQTLAASAGGMTEMAGQQKSMNSAQKQQRTSNKKNAANNGKETKVVNGTKNSSTTFSKNPATSNNSGSHLTNSIDHDQQVPMVMSQPMPNLITTTLKATLPG